MASLLRLLLQQLCLVAMPDNAVICKLLCCSKATSALVHQFCAGKLTVQLCPPVKDNIDRPQLSSWLAKHARLLRHLSLDCFYVDVEEYAAAGLRAAAGLPSMRPAAAEPTVGQQEMDVHVDLAVQAIVQAEAAAQAVVQAEAAAHAVVQAEAAAQAVVQAEAAAQRGLMLMQPPGDSNQQHEAPQQAGVSMLPLLELQLQGRLVGTLLPTMSACCRQLTQLQLRPSRTDWLPPTDLSQLHSLRELQIIGGLCCSVPDNTLRIFSSLTQLTRLDASFLGTQSFTHLPASLVELSAACGLSIEDEMAPAGQGPGLRHLTNLTRLKTGGVRGSQMLPAQLRELHAFELRWDEGFLQLQQLKFVSLTAVEIVPCLGPLSALTQLTALQLRTTHVKGGMSVMCSELPRLPLQHFYSSDDAFSAQDIEQLGRCTKLTELQMDVARVGVGVGAFAQQLQRLHSLQHLRLDSVRFAPHPATPEDVEPLVVALKQLCGRHLTRVRLCLLTLSRQQQSGLRGLLGPGFSYREGQPLSDSAYTDDEPEGEADGPMPGDEDGEDGDGVDSGDGGNGGDDGDGDGALSSDGGAAGLEAEGVEL
jgi:hypothetical protein